jgi:hypothetical protein
MFIDREVWIPNVLPVSSINILFPESIVKASSMSLSAIPDLELNLKDEERNRIRAHLEKVISSAPFAHSQRSQAFIRYIVEESLEGRGEQIKERNIGVDVFGKAEDFDPQEESLVRVCAGEVRKRLAHAYQSDFHDGVRIELPLGTYTPRFEVKPTPLPETHLPAFAVNSTTKPARNRLFLRKWAISIPLLAAFVIGIISAGYRLHRREQEPLDLLWQSFSLHREPVLIALPTPTVLQPKHADDLAKDLENGHLLVDEFDVQDGSFTGIGAALGAARFAEQLAQRHQPFVVKFGFDASFPDLSTAPAILLGGFTSALGQKLMRNVRYQLFITDKDTGIRDTFLKGKIWQIPNHVPSSKIEQGYALVTILHNSDFKQPILQVAGLSAVDTASAVQFLTDREYFEEFTKQAPHDWFKKNCQIVLYSHEYGNSPGRPELVTWYVW